MNSIECTMSRFSLREKERRVHVIVIIVNWTVMMGNDDGTWQRSLQILAHPLLEHPRLVPNSPYGLLEVNREY